MLTTMALGNKAANFTLPDCIDDLDITLNDYALDDHNNAAPVVIAFICNHCPFVKHIIDHFLVIAKDYQTKGIKFIAICPNDSTVYPEDSPEKMREFAEFHAFSFPYCYDETQEVTSIYQAICTPDFYVFDQQHQLAYHGRFDDSRPNSHTAITGDDLALALNCVLDNQAFPGTQHPSLGCSIKWKKT